MYLEDMINSMERIIEYIHGLSYENIQLDQKTIDAVVRNFEIIGEATKNIPDIVKNKYPDIPWRAMYSLRNRISHEYFGIDFELIWDIAQNHLPMNLIQVKSIISEIK